MAKIELSLKSNIDLITASGLGGWKINSKELEPTIKRISKNFFSPFGESIALEAFRLWLKYQDRDFVQSLFAIAYDIEMQWREAHNKKAFVKIASNPHSFEKVPFTRILAMTVPIELELRDALRQLSYREFLNTPYWRSVRTATLEFYGFECQMFIKRDGYPPIQCGKTTELEVHHRTYQHAKGLEHRNFRNDLIVYCSQCHLRSHLDEPNEVEWRKVGVSGANA